MDIRKYFGCILIACTCVTFTIAQDQTSDDSKPGQNKFLLSGSANSVAIIDGETFEESLFGVGWLPIFLWSPSDRLLFEGHLHIEVEAESGISEGGGHSHGGVMNMQEPEPGGSGAMVMLGYADLVFIINDYMTLTAGQFVSPFGTFQERFHPAWVNKLPDAPLGLGHHNSIAPADELGVQLRGGVPFGRMKLNYSVYVSNGPVLLTSEEDGGKLKFENFTDNNTNKALGGRIGILPFSNSMLELGGSVLSGKVGSAGTKYENIAALLYGADIGFYKSISGFGDLNIKGQWIHAQVDDASYPMDTMIQITGTDTTYLTEYVFKNGNESIYGQISYRPSMAESFVKNLEFVTRYDAISMPEETMWASSDSRYTFGVDYWFQARSVVKFAYQIGENSNVLMAQLVIGF